MEDLLIWIPLLPALAALLCGVLGPRVLKGWSHWPAILAMVATFLLFVRGWLSLSEETPVIEASYWTWMAAGNFTIDFGLRLDALSCTMGFIVSFVGLLIFIYSVGYMHGDPGYGRYFCFVSLFAAMMYALILGNNLVVLFLGWEGVGLCSYLLIGFWYEDYEKASAAKKAFVVNRIGDAAFLVGMFLLWKYTGTLNFGELAELVPAVAALPVGLVALLLFIGATGKSAQIPLFVWLPDAMAGPTPVSALIHAATMVTAGVYMVARTHFVYSHPDSAWAMFIVALIGTLTALLAALIAITQRDIKKVLAYSTVSQLGYMFLALGVGAYAVAIFHVLTHAFFKACLFMVSGNVIHGMGGEQDMCKMGGLKKDMPLSFWSCVLSGAALAAIFPFAGFWSKDEIIGAAMKLGTITPGMAGIAYMTFASIGILVGGLTAFYITRLIILTFLGEPRHHHHAHEAPGSMIYPVLILAGLSVVGGFFNLVLPGIAEPATLSYFLETVDAQHGGGHGHGPLADFAHPGPMMVYTLMIISTLVALAAVFIAYRTYLPSTAPAEERAKKYGGLFHLSYNKFFVDEAYDATAVKGTWKASVLSAWFDRRIIDGILDLGRQIVVLLGYFISMFQRGKVQDYAWLMAVGVVLVALIGLLVGGGS